MAGIWHIFCRELKSYLYSPLAYVILAVYLAIGGYIFSVVLLATRSAELRGYFSNIGLILLFLVPVLTMRLWAEEEQRGTAEFLLTAPVGLGQVLVGKYLASAAVFLIGVGLSLVYPLILGGLGQPDWGTIACGYLGLVLFGLAYLAVGLFGSAMSSSQVVAGVLSFGLLLAFWVVGWLSEAFGGKLGEVAKALTVVGHYEDFLKGVIDTTHLIYFASFIGIFIFLAVEGLKSRHGA
ncbi:MAG: ABC transporter permease subunit [Clostridia bacterium]|jgi:ABC-2 type transport system permease protein|nr:ABC transporter permease subunit [Clostridia bacterium]MDH7572597.1 ABC transporter permease subunit [Clostridia bacterium]